MNIQTKLNLFLLLLTPLGAAAGGDEQWEALRHQRLNRIERVIVNSDGGDVFLPRDLPATRENFIAQRLYKLVGSQATTLCYSPLSSYTQSTCPLQSGEFLTNDNPSTPDLRNTAREFAAMGSDPVRMAGQFCRENNLEFFLSLRVNDTHDAAGTTGKPHYQFSGFKRSHPEYLMGTPENPPPWCTWSALDFSHPEVREHFVSAVAEFAETYDLDGIEYDFMRHLQLFKSVAWGGIASPEELDQLSEMMMELRRITEQAGQKHGHPILIAVRVPDSVEFCRAVGIDIERWLREGLIDIMIGGSYFQLRPWQDSVELARKYQVKFYPSLGSESRITRRKGSRFIRGRGNNAAFYYATISAARRAGCDGVYFFNTDYRPAELFRELVRGDVEDVENMTRFYFATERGSGGYEPSYYLAEGYRYEKMSIFDPGYPRRIIPSAPVNFSIMIGEDLAGDQNGKLKTTAQLRSPDAGKAEFTLTVNGHPLTGTPSGEIVKFKIPNRMLRPGKNDFSLAVRLIDDAHPVSYQLKELKAVLTGRNQRPWLRPFGNVQPASRESIVDRAYRIADHGDGAGLFYPFPPGECNEINIDFQLRTEKSDHPGDVVMRIADGHCVETIGFEKNRINFIGSNTGVDFPTGKKFHTYRATIARGNLTLSIDGKEVLSAPFRTPVDTPEARGIFPGGSADFDRGFFIGSVNRGEGTSLWKNLSVSYPHATVDDFCLFITPGK